MADKKTGKEEKKPEKIVISPELRRIWLKARHAWVTSFAAFSNSLSVLNDTQAEVLYNIVKHSLFRASPAAILKEHPELRELLRSDEDRLCMHDIYEVLSWRLNKQEIPPSDVKLMQRMKGRIGRDSIDMSGR